LLSGVQLIEQDLRLLEIERVEAFGELILDQSEEFAGRSPLALVAPEPRHAHRRAQFPGLCLLLAGTRVGASSLHSRNYRHADIEEDEEHDETAHEGPEYDM